MDDQDNVQYGPASVAWAATAPGPSTESPGPGEITQGFKDDDATSKTTAIDWFVKMDQGFTYDVRTVSATVADPSELGSCADDGSGNTTFTVNRDDAHERFRLTSPATYTEYKACVRATNDQGASTWTALPSFKTLPAGPARLAGTLDTTTAPTSVTTEIDWSFSASATMPVDPGDYEVRVTDNANDVAVKLDAKTCAANTGDPVESVIETGSGFGFSSSHTFVRNLSTEVDKKHTILACVRAMVGTDRFGPWKALAKSVNVPKQAALQ